MGYSVYVIGPDRNSKQEVSADATSVEISDLHPSTEYTFAISATTVAGDGPVARTSSVTPQKSETVISFSISRCYVVAK